MILIHWTEYTLRMYVNINHLIRGRARRLDHCLIRCCLILHNGCLKKSTTLQYFSFLAQSASGRPPCTICFGATTATVLSPRNKSPHRGKRRVVALPQRPPGVPHRARHSARPGTSPVEAPELDCWPPSARRSRNRLLQRGLTDGREIRRTASRS